MAAHSADLSSVPLPLKILADLGDRGSPAYVRSVHCDEGQPRSRSTSAGSSPPPSILGLGSPPGLGLEVDTPSRPTWWPPGLESRPWPGSEVAAVPPGLEPFAGLHAAGRGFGISPPGLEEPSTPSIPPPPGLVVKLCLSDATELRSLGGRKQEAVTQYTSARVPPPPPLPPSLPPAHAAPLDAPLFSALLPPPPTAPPSNVPNTVAPVVVPPPPISAPTWSPGDLAFAVPHCPPLAPALGSALMPTVGSMLHNQRECKPCAFVHSQGCAKGVACKFCHLCSKDERKRRKKDERKKRCF